MSEYREKKQRFVVSGYTREVSGQYKINMPSDIVSIIFTLYYIKFLSFEHSKKIGVKDNIDTDVTNEGHDHFNTTVIGDWMDLHSEHQYIHTMRLKIIEMMDAIQIGI